MTLKLTAGGGSTLQWTTSSYSSNDGPECVEVAASPTSIHVRDSKDLARSPLAFTHTGWAGYAAYAAAHAPADR